MTKLKKCILDSGLKQNWLADRAGLTISEMTAYATGRKTPSIEILAQLAGLMRVQLEDVTGNVEGV